MKKGEKKADAERIGPKLNLPQMVGIEEIRPSPANPRNWNGSEEGLASLALSIKAEGLLQYPLARTVPETDGVKYELVFGERRFRACRSAGFTAIPVIVRELNDFEAHTLTALENMQREDLTPYEEAQGIKNLLASGNDPEAIAEKLGKPVRWVMRRAKLRDLSAKWLAAIADPEHVYSKWTVSHLELVARFEPMVQDEIFESYLRSWNSATISAKDLAKGLEGYMLKLSAAPWKMDQVLTQAKGERSLAACCGCQKRTSRQGFLFDEGDEKEKKSDRCLDKECWKEKLSAFVKMKQAELFGKYDNLILVDHAPYSDNILDTTDPSKREAINHHRIEKAKKTDKDARPALVVDGPGAGTVEWVTVYGSIEPDRRGSNSGPKTLKERKKALEKRRNNAILRKVIDELDLEIETLAHCKRLSNVQMLRMSTLFELRPHDYSKYFDGNKSAFILEENEVTNEQRDLVESIFTRAVVDLRRMVNSDLNGSGTITAAKDAFAILGLDFDGLTEQIKKQIPEPKAWKKLKGENNG